MLILGIDPGTAITGFGLIEAKGSNLKFIGGGVIRTPAKQELGLRLVTIYEELDQLIRKHHPQQMAVELLYFAANVTTAISVSHARGVVLLLAAQHSLPLKEYTPLQVKQALTSYGRADKKQVQAMVKRLLGLSAIPQPDDAADALAVAICHSAAITS